MKKIFSIFLVAFFICGVISTFQTTTVTAATSGDFRYTTSGYTATITGYNSNVTGAVNIPNKLDNYLVTAIAPNAFSGNSQITSITMPDTITSIGDSAFEKCINLKTITFSNNLVSLGFRAFACCSSLKKAIIPNSVTYLGRDAFYLCNSLEEISVPFVGANSGEYTKLSDLIESNSLKKVVVTGGTSIADEAFEDCETLESVILPSTLTSIGESPFANCKKLSSISIDKNNTKYHSKGNCIIETATKTMVLGCNNSVIPNDGSVKTISSSAFNRLTGIKKIVIPNSVTKIDGNALYQCFSLEELAIPFIGNTLDGASNTEFSYIFGSSNELIDVIFPKLKKLTITGRCKLPELCFMDCKALKEVVIGDNVYCIGKYAFLNCKNLEKVTIGSGVKEIEKSAFTKCSSLKQIIIPSNVQTIKFYAFSTCEKLESVIINNPSIDLEKLAFDGSNSVKIYCAKGSNAENYAKSNNIPYEYITVPTQNTNSSQNQTTNNNSNNGTPTNNNISNNTTNSPSSNTTNNYQNADNQNETIGSNSNTTQNDTDSSNKNKNKENSSPSDCIIVFVVFATLIVLGGVVFFITKRKTAVCNKK